MLGGDIFQKTYPLFKGDLSYTFRSPGGSEARQLTMLMRQIPGDNTYNTSVDQMQLRLLFYLKQFNDTEYDPTEATTFEDAMKEYHSRFGEWPEGRIAAAIKINQEFIQLTQTLLDTGFDESFYDSVGLG